MDTNRTRINTNSLVSLPIWSELKPVGGSFAEQSGTRTLCKNSVLDYMDDVVSSNFRKRIGSGEIINHPMFKAIDTRVASGGSYRSVLSDSSEVRLAGTGSVTEWAMTRGAFQPIVIDTSVDTSPRESAMLRAIAAIDSTPYAYSEDVFELTKTLEFLRSPFSAIRRLAKDFRRSRDRKISVHGTANAIASTWLEYRFGFMPLAITSSNLLKQFSEGVTARATSEFRRKRRTARATGSSGYQRSGTSFQNYGSSTRTFDWTYVGNHNWRVGILYEVSNPINELHELSGLRFKELPRTAWNLVPYTWLVDRFLNVSDAIQAITNLSDPNVNILAAWIRGLGSIRETYRWVGATATGQTITLSGDTVVNTYTHSARNPWYPTVRDAVPHIALPRNELITAADTLALVTQLFTR